MNSPNPIVDGHVAVGDGDVLGHTRVDDLLRSMDSEGVATSVLGPIGRWAAVDNAEGNRLLESWARAHPQRFRTWAVANPWYGDRAIREVRRAFGEGAVGLKLLPAVQGFSLLSLPLDSLLDVAADHAMPVYVVTGIAIASEPLQLTELARRHPDVTFVMGRSGRTDFSLDFLPALTAVTNIVAETAYNGANVIADLVSAVGPARVAFTSDAPANDLGLELDRVRRAGVSPEDLDAVLSGAALGLDVVTPTAGDRSDPCS